jgi:hypothetical protein
LAYKSGRLTGRDQSRVQRWALGYQQYAERLIQADQYDEIRKVLHFILRANDAKIYELAFPRIEVNDPDVVPGHSYGVDDLEGLEKLLRKIDGMQTKSQADLNGTEWTEWR